MIDAMHNKLTHYAKQRFDQWFLELEIATNACARFWKCDTCESTITNACDSYCACVDWLVGWMRYWPLYGGSAVQLYACRFWHRFLFYFWTILIQSYVEKLNTNTNII